jgi:hypothetical protein
VRWLLVAASVVPSSPILVTLMKEALGSSETSGLIRAAQRNIPFFNGLCQKFPFPMPTYVHANTCGGYAVSFQNASKYELGVVKA